MGGSSKLLPSSSRSATSDSRSDARRASLQQSLGRSDCCHARGVRPQDDEQLVSLGQRLLQRCAHARWHVEHYDVALGGEQLHCGGRMLAERHEPHVLPDPVHQTRGARFVARLESDFPDLRPLRQMGTEGSFRIKVECRRAPTCSS
jgi:hypothetical protein